MEGGKGASGGVLHRPESMPRPQGEHDTAAFMLLLGVEYAGSDWEEAGSPGRASGGGTHHPAQAQAPAQQSTSPEQPAGQRQQAGDNTGDRQDPVGDRQELVGERRAIPIHLEAPPARGSVAGEGAVVVTRESSPPLTRGERVAGNWETLVRDCVAKRTRNGSLGRRIRINCGGQDLQAYESHLLRYPGTLLSDMISPDGELSHKSTVFLDRHPLCGVEIVNCYRDGFLPEKPRHIDPEVWQSELLHFRMHKSRVPIPGLQNFIRLYQSDDDHIQEKKGKPTGKVGLFIWKLLEEPSSSKGARVVSIISLSFVLGFVVVVLAETLPEVTADPESVRILDVIDLVIVAYFSLEFLVRIGVSTNKIYFCRRALNIIDLVSIVPTWLSLVFPAIAASSWGRFFRTLRVLRVLKVARHSDGLRVLGRTFMAASNELVQVLLCFTIAWFLFAAVIFYTEEDSVGEPAFESIVDALWWAIITLCTVGYGDKYPTTPLGQFVGSMACVTAVVMVALPISVINSTFEEKFAEHREKLKLQEAKRRESIDILGKANQVWSVTSVFKKQIKSLENVGRSVSMRSIGSSHRGALQNSRISMDVPPRGGATSRLSATFRRFNLSGGTNKSTDGVSGSASVNGSNGSLGVGAVGSPGVGAIGSADGPASGLASVASPVLSGTRSLFDSGEFSPMRGPSGSHTLSTPEMAPI